MTLTLIRPLCELTASAQAEHNRASPRGSRIKDAHEDSSFHCDHRVCCSHWQHRTPRSREFAKALHYRKGSLRLRLGCQPSSVARCAPASHSSRVTVDDKRTNYELPLIAATNRKEAPIRMTTAARYTAALVARRHAHRLVRGGDKDETGKPKARATRDAVTPRS